MSWNNVLLNVNGKSDADLLDTLRLVFSMHSPKGAKGYIKDKEKGLILVWYTGSEKEAVPFPGRLTAEEALPLVTAYLQSEDAESVEKKGWEEDTDHDGSNGVGWRVYAEDWGHVKTHYAICAVKRVFLWYGK